MELREVGFIVATIVVMTVLFGNARILGLTVLAATSVLVLVFHRFSGNYTQLPSFSEAVVFVGVYILAGFITTVIWHLVFLFSVRSKYRQFLSSPEFVERLGEIRESYLRMSADELQKFEDFISQEESPYIRTSYLNAQVDLIKYNFRTKFYDFGPTTDLAADLWISLITSPHYFDGGAVYHPEVCEEFLNELLPPKVSRIWKVLVVVLIFWPSALLWLICGHLVKSCYTFTLGLARRLYDRLGVFVFRKI